jgi:undecaprenyl-diphosphatase
VKPVPLIAAALIAVVGARRWPRLTRANRALALAVAAGLVVYGTGIVHLPNLETVIRGAGRTLGSFTYLLVGTLAFLETGAGVGLIAPGELAVIVGGVSAGQGQIDLWLLIGLVWTCALAGDVTSFFLGRRLGREFMLRHGPKLKLTPERIEQVERFFARHGGKTLLIGRFIGLVRALAPFLAGASRMPFRKFIPYTFIAAAAWAATFSVLGYVFWQSFDQVAHVAKHGAFALTTVVAVITGAIIVYRHLRDPENRNRAIAWARAQAKRPHRDTATRPTVSRQPGDRPKPT